MPNSSTRASARPVWCILLVACGSQEPEIKGGTQDQRRVVEAILDEFRDSSSFFPDISGIAIRDFRKAEGRYNKVTRMITLSNDTSLEALRINARHEMCHAVDFQLPFGSDEIEGWGDSNLDRREAFAGFCQVGPQAISSVVNCGGLYAQQGSRMAEEIFDRHVHPSPVTWGSPVGSFELESGVELRSVLATENRTVVLATSQGIQLVSLEGDPLEPGVDPGVVPAYDVVTMERTSLWQFREEPLLWADDVVGIGDWRIDEERQLSQVLVVNDGIVISSACAFSEDELFVLGGEIWMARVEGQVVQWAPLTW